MFFRKMFEQRDFTLDNPALAQFLGLDIGNISVSDKNALKVATVYACIKIRAESVAKLPLKLYDNKNKAVDHPLYNLFKIRPNPYMSPTDFWKAIESQRALYGNAYVYIDANKKGKINGLYPLDSTKVQVILDNQRLLNDNSVWYVITLLDGTQIKLKPTEILHFKGDITLDGLIGINPLDYLRVTLENAKATQEFINSYFKQGLQVKGIIQYVGDLSPDAQKTFKEKFEEMSSGLKNSSRVSLLPIGYQFQPISNSLADAQFLENTKYTMQQIATIYGIPVHKLNDLQKSSYASLSEAEREFYQNTLLPILKGYEEEINYKLLLNAEIIQGLYFKFNADSILRTDIKTRYDSYRVGIQSGFLTPNEVRAFEDLEPIDGGNELLLNGNVQKIKDIGVFYKDKQNVVNQGGASNE